LEVVFVINISTITQVSILLKKSEKERHNAVFLKCHNITGVPPSLCPLSDSYSGFMMLSFLDNDMSHFLQRPQNILDPPLGPPIIYIFYGVFLATEIFLILSFLPVLGSALLAL
jgi:hypothetical protein